MADFHKERFPITRKTPYAQPERFIFSLPTLTFEEIETYGIPIWSALSPTIEWVGYLEWKNRLLPEDLQHNADVWMKWWQKHQFKDLYVKELKNEQT